MKPRELILQSFGWSEIEVWEENLRVGIVIDIEGILQYDDRTTCGHWRHFGGSNHELDEPLRKHLQMERVAQMLHDLCSFLGEHLARGKMPYCVLTCLLYTSPSPRDKRQSRMPSSA